MVRALAVSFLSLVAASSCLAEIQLRGVAGNGAAYLLVLTDSESGKSSGWIEVGSSFEGYEVTGFDPARDAAQLRRNGVATMIVLQAAHARGNAGVRLHTEAIPDEDLAKLGFYRVQRGDTGSKIALLVHLTRPALEAMNPGVKWAALKVGQILVIGDPLFADEPAPLAEPGQRQGQG